MSTKKNRKIVIESLFGDRPELGDTIYHLRKCAKVSQGELGDVLGVHQSAVSRVESGEQKLTPKELWDLGRFFSVSVDDLLHGSVNYWGVAKAFGQKAPFPPRYSEFASSRVREIWPLILFLNKTKGHKFTSKLLSKLEVNNILFLNPDQQVGANLYLDLLRESMEARALTQDNLSKLVEFARHDVVHGPLGALYKAQSSSISVVQSLLLNSSFYESNFDHQIESVSSHGIEVSVIPGNHLKQVVYRDDVLDDFLCRFKKEHYANFPIYIDQKPMKLEEKECHFHGASRCVYKLAAA